MRSIIVQRRMKNESSHLDELKSLAKAANYIVVSSLEQVRYADPSFQIGRGKAEKLVKLVKDLEVDKIIFDNDLSPTQSYNLAKVTGVEAIDRFQLILEIFAKRASTKEAKLQIKLANLRYQLPRAKASVRLAKMGERPGFLGLGRYEIDVHFENISRQITQIRRELERISEKRSLHRIRRIESGFFLVSLAGYTNAGKTTLFNTLVKESKPVNLDLFTTLSTTTRSVNFKGKRVLLTDTVGFIDRLPIVLVESFHSTLEETILADVIILVVDIHEPIEEVQKKLDVCLTTIREIGAGTIPIITAFNKADLLTKEKLEEKKRIIEQQALNPVVISALKARKLGELEQIVANHLENYLQVTFILPINDNTLSFLSELHGQVGVLETFYEGKQVKVVVHASPWFMNKIYGQVKKLKGQLLKSYEIEK